MRLHTDGKVSARFAGFSYKTTFIKKAQEILKNIRNFNFMIKSYLDMLGITPQETWAQSFSASKNTSLQSQNCQKMDILFSKIKNS